MPCYFNSSRQVYGKWSASSPAQANTPVEQRQPGVWCTGANTRIQNICHLEENWKESNVMYSTFIYDFSLLFYAVGYVNGCLSLKTRQIMFFWRFFPLLRLPASQEHMKTFTTAGLATCHAFLSTFTAIKIAFIFFFFFFWEARQNIHEKNETKDSLRPRTIYLEWWDDYKFPTEQVLGLSHMKIARVSWR